MSVAEFHIHKAEGTCFRCLKGKHFAANCTNQPKPFPDDPVPPV